ncbi:MAG: LiaF-related protein, partial [Bacilli bacterium]|nr:LiaF-related protein [Bacilli bacterium]
LLLMCNDYISFELISKLFIPVVLIVTGILILSKDFLRTNIKNKIKSIEVSNDDEFYAIFGSNTIKPKQDEINGATINAIFGELKCDLRDTKITKDIVINATSVFGGMTILVPEDVNVITTATPIFGGVDNKAKGSRSENTIYIKGTVLFGGIEIK